MTACVTKDDVKTLKCWHSIILKTFREGTEEGTLVHVHIDPYLISPETRYDWQIIMVPSLQDLLLGVSTSNMKERAADAQDSIPIKNDTDVR